MINYSYMIFLFCSILLESPWLYNYKLVGASGWLDVGFIFL
jgi:hypothetical protein